MNSISILCQQSKLFHRKLYAWRSSFFFLAISLNEVCWDERMLQLMSCYRTWNIKMLLTVLIIICLRFLLSSIWKKIHFIYSRNDFLGPKDSAGDKAPALHWQQPYFESPETHMVFQANTEIILKSEPGVAPENCRCYHSHSQKNFRTERNLQ